MLSLIRHADGTAAHDGEDIMTIIITTRPQRADRALSTSVSDIDGRHAVSRDALPSKCGDLFRGQTII